jgi:hypothetical protein
MRNTKHQTPSSRDASSVKSLVGQYAVEFGSWGLMLPWGLGLEVWNLVA